MGLQIFGMPKRKKENKAKKERVSKQKLLKGCHQEGQNLLFQPFQSVQNSKVFLVAQPWWPTILFSVPWHLHFEIHFAGPVFKKVNNTTGKSSNKKSLSSVNIYSITCSFTERFSVVNIHSRTCNIHSLTGVNGLFMQ